MDDARENPGVRDWSFFLHNQFDMAGERLAGVVNAGVARLDKGLILLAIISSAAPFLGLFGTVWGVMNSFYQIGSQGSASLPVVAPGIAEALITTIVGLAVAIPAVFFYNYFMHRVERTEDEMVAVRDQVLLRLKRDILAEFYADPGSGTEGAGQ